MNTVVSFLPNAGATTNISDDIHRAFAAQHETALRLRTSTVKERIAKIQRLLDAVLAHRDAIYDAAYKDFKKPPAEVVLAEILPIVSEAKHAMRSLKGWMKPKGVRTEEHTSELQSIMRTSNAELCLQKK